MENMENQDNPAAVEFAGGTKRSSRKPPYFLVPLELMELVGWTRFDGDARYQPGNWMKGDREFFIDCLSHAIEHCMLAPFDEAEDFTTHLGHAACNLAFIAWAVRRGKVTREDFVNAAQTLASVRAQCLPDSKT